MWYVKSGAPCEAVFSSWTLLSSAWGVTCSAAWIVSRAWENITGKATSHCQNDSVWLCIMYKNLSTQSGNKKTKKPNKQLIKQLKIENLKVGDNKNTLPSYWFNMLLVIPEGISCVISKKLVWKVFFLLFNSFLKHNLSREAVKNENKNKFRKFADLINSRFIFN